MIRQYKARTATWPDKGKPLERAGRKAADLNPERDTVAGPPGEYSTSRTAYRFGRKKVQEVQTVKGRNVTITTLEQPFVRACMMLVLILMLACALPVSQALAAQANLSWNAPTTYADGSPLTSLSGYKIYVGSVSGSYSQTIDVGNTTGYTLGNLNDASTYYFATTAYDASGNSSGYSNEVSYTTPTPAPSSPVYTLTASAGSGGSITPSSSVAISQGLNQTFTISPNSGYKIASVTVDGVSVGAVSTYTFSNVTANHTISVTFAANTTSYSITASAGAGGVISPTGSAAVNSGGSQAYTITPSSGYKIAGVTVDGVSVGAVANYTFSNVTANHTISATFVANTTSYSITASAGAGGVISPVGSAAVNSGGNQAYTITPNSGYKIAGVSVDGVSVGAVSTYTFSNVTANHTIQANFSASSIVGTVNFAVNSGGAAYTSSTGIKYLADTKYSGGSISKTTATISGTTEGALYQSERYGNFSYNIPVANGSYAVTLKFAEIYFSAAGQRVFSVTINGKTAVSNLDIFAKVGKNKAYDVVIPVTVTNGAISIKFVSQVNNAKVNAIAVAPASTVVFAANSGGSQYASSTGTTYLADTKFSGGSISTTTATISGTTEGTLYQSERYGNFTYNVPVANGNYTVTLKFAEIYYSAAGQRVFSVNINGQTVISNLDLYAKVGKNAAYDVAIPVSVTNGAININFVSQVNNAKVSGMLIEKM